MDKDNCQQQCKERQLLCLKMPGLYAVLAYVVVYYGLQWSIESRRDKLTITGRNQASPLFSVTTIFQIVIVVLQGVAALSKLSYIGKGVNVKNSRRTDGKTTYE